jgi:hypothetical protein
MIIQEVMAYLDYPCDNLHLGSQVDFLPKTNHGTSEILISILLDDVNSFQAPPNAQFSLDEETLSKFTMKNISMFPWIELLSNNLRLRTFP